jgi:starvation-inducible DNA-binding protein
MNYLGLNTELTEKTSNALNRLLANYHLYYQKLRSFHWTIKGENFFELHEKFEDLYNQAKVEIDDIAERILTLRRRPISRMSDYLEMSDIAEQEGKYNDREMVEAILKDHTILIKYMRKAIEVAGEAKDEGTIDLIGASLRNLEQQSWMLDAWMTKQVKAERNKRASIEIA